MWNVSEVNPKKRNKLKRPEDDSRDRQRIEKREERDEAQLTVQSITLGIKSNNRKE